MSLLVKSTLAVALIGGLTAGGVVGIVRAASADQPVVSANRQNLDESWPHMRKALRDLKGARDSLVDAEDVFKGRREEAIKHTDEAIKEVEAALSEH